VASIRDKRFAERRALANDGELSIRQAPSGVRTYCRVVRRHCQPEPSDLWPQVVVVHHFPDETLASWSNLSADWRQLPDSLPSVDELRP
jgi:hypothetical protein